jgi:uncharacterized membrane protein
MFGFITQHDLSSLGISQDKIAVYIPYSYTFAGNLYIVPAANVKQLQANSTEIMKFIVSAGVTTIPNQRSPDILNEKNH